jgi:hypothetical protein
MSTFARKVSVRGPVGTQAILVTLVQWDPFIPERYMYIRWKKPRRKTVILNESMYLTNQDRPYIV